MLVLRAQNAHGGGLRLGGFQLRFGLRDGLIRIDTGFVERLRQIERLLVGDHGRVQQILERIFVAKLVVIDRDLGLRGQPHIFEIGGAGLRGAAIGRHGISDASPQVRLPGESNGRRIP